MEENLTPRLLQQRLSFFEPLWFWFLKSIAQNSFCLFYPEDKIKIESFLQEVWQKLPKASSFFYVGLATAGAFLFFAMSLRLKLPCNLSDYELEKTLSRCFFNPFYPIRLLSYAIKSQSSIALYRT